MRGPAPTHASAWLTMRRRGLGRRPDGCEPAGRGDAAGPCCRAGEVSGEASYSGLPLRGVVYRSPGSALDEARPEMPLTVPLLPFTPDEVLLPGGVKTLHLYEARCDGPCGFVMCCLCCGVSGFLLCCLVCEWVVQGVRAPPWLQGRERVKCIHWHSRAGVICAGKQADTASFPLHYLHRPYSFALTRYLSMLEEVLESPHKCFG